MRRLIILLLLFPVCLSAQKKDVDIFGRGWYLSLTVQPERERDFTFTPYVNANDTLPMEASFFGRILPRRADTVQLNGNNVAYFREPGLERTVRREQAIFDLLGRLRLHYRTGDRWEFSAGVFYELTSSTNAPRIDGPTDLPNDFFYVTSDFRKTFGGVVTDASYHLRKGKRLRPYLGAQVNIGIQRQRVILVSRRFPGLNREEDITDEITERFLTNTIFDFDLDLLAGVNYQFSDRWAIGLEIKLNQFLLPTDPRALQLRYRLRKNREERSR